MATQNEEPYPSIPIGQKRRMGTTNDKYRIDEVGDQENGDWWVYITILSTGEKARMKWTDIQGDDIAD